MNIFTSVNAIIFATLLILLFLLIETKYSDFASDNFNAIFLLVIAFLFVAYDSYRIYLTYAEKEITPNYMSSRIFSMIHLLLVVIFTAIIFYLRSTNPQYYTFNVFLSFVAVCFLVYLYEIGYFIYSII